MFTTAIAGRVAAVVAAAALTLGATAALANDAPVKADPKTDTRRYCVVGASTGTMFKQRSCRTRAEWIAATGIDPVQKRR
jgi:hypothetical protein